MPSSRSGVTPTFSTCSASFTPLCSQDRATMGSPSTRLPTGLSQLLARWSAMLQHLICPLASADRSREPVGAHLHHGPHHGQGQSPAARAGPGRGQPAEPEQGSGTRHAAVTPLDAGNGKHWLQSHRSEVRGPALGPLTRRKSTSPWDSGPSPWSPSAGRDPRPHRHLTGPTRGR